MKKIYLAFLLTLGLLSCEDVTNCTNAELSANIKTLGFGDLTTQTVSFHKFDPKTDALKKIKIEEIKYQDNESLTGYGESTIILEEYLFSKENYRLIINDEKYDITDIKIKSEVRMIGMREDSICRVNAFKINNKTANLIHHTPALTFHKPN